MGERLGALTLRRRILIGLAASVCLALLAFEVGRMLTGGPGGPQVLRRQGNGEAGQTLRLVDFGAKCDGHTDDRSAVDAALTYLGSNGGGTLVFPNSTCRVVETPSTIYLGVPANVSLAGEGPRSGVSLDCPDSTSYVEGFRLGGSSVSLSNLTLTRVANCPGVMLAVHSVSGLVLSHVTINGGSDHFSSEMHGIELTGVEGPSSHIKLDHVTLSDLDYGLFQPNSETEPVSDISVLDSTFTGNFMDDLEFNAPSGTMTGIEVSGSTFKHNQRTEEGAGFGIGLANVQHVVISGNRFGHYRFEPIHIEDRSADISIKNNQFKHAFTAGLPWASHIDIINNSHHVWITHNQFNTFANRNPVLAVYIGDGGTGFPNPSDVQITNNMFKKGRHAQLLSASGIAGVVSSPNQTRRMHAHRRS